MATASKRKRKDLTLAEKLDIIADYERTNSTRSTAANFGIGFKTVARIYENRDELRKLFEENKSLAGHHINRKLSETGLKIDQLVYDWFVAARAKLIPISGVLIQIQARAFAERLKDEDKDNQEEDDQDQDHQDKPKFAGSNGWLDAWKKRHNISSKVISGESAAVDLVPVEDFRFRIPGITLGFQPKDIFNADETGLFYRALPTRSLIIRGENCNGGKFAKERLSVLLCASQTGEKIKPFVIGKSENPRCFRHVDKKKLPITWRANKKAWMTTALFNDFLNSFNNQMRREKRKVSVLIEINTFKQLLFLRIGIAIFG